MTENDATSDGIITNKVEDTTPKKKQNSCDYYSLLSDKLLYLVKFRDRLLIFTTIIVLTILSLSIPTNNIYAPVLVSLVAFIFLIKWCNIKKKIRKSSSYLQVYYEQAKGMECGCTWESDYHQYDKKYNTLYRFENFCLYLSWIILAIIPFLVSLGIFLLDKTDGKPGINDFAIYFMSGINLFLVLLGIITIIGILFVLQTRFFRKERFCHMSHIARIHIGCVVFAALPILMGISFSVSPFCRLIVECLINSPSVLIILVIELIFVIMVAFCIIKLGLSSSDQDKFAKQWREIREESNQQINPPQQEGAN